MTSAVILGLNSLLYPFKWCLALIPILPRPLIEVLEAPLPILVGITESMLHHITLDESEISSKIWVNLSKQTISWQTDYENTPIFSLGN